MEKKASKYLHKRAKELLNWLKKEVYETKKEFELPSIFLTDRKKSYIKPIKNGTTYKYIIFLGTRAREIPSYWTTYKKKRVKYYAEFIHLKNITEKIDFILIHELSHFLDFQLFGKTDEVFPTRCEILFAQNKYPEYYKKLKYFK